MARFDPDQAGINRFLLSDGVRDALERKAENVQARAAQITAVEAVDTGLMAASWRVEMIPAPRGWIARIYNRAESAEGFGYPAAIEFGWRHHRSGRHIAGRRILGRALDAARL